MPARAAALRADGDQNAGGWFSGVLAPTHASCEEAADVHERLYASGIRTTIKLSTLPRCGRRLLSSGLRNGIMAPRPREWRLSLSLRIQRGPSMRHLAHGKRFLIRSWRGRVHPPALAAALGALTSLSACISLPPDLAASGHVTVERVDSDAARVQEVHVWAADSRLKVSGTLSQPNGRRGLIPGCLHIQAIGEGGASLATTTTPYYPRTVKARQAEFFQVLPVAPGEVRVLRVIHHGPSEESR